MRLLIVIFCFCSFPALAQYKDFLIGVKGDTLNRTDLKNQKQGKWVSHIDEVRGEPGFEEEGEYKNNRKEGGWRLYDLNGDLIGLENYRWGNKDGMCQYFIPSGQLVREERWKAMNPDKLYDTLEIEDIDHLNEYRTVIVKNEGAAIKHGTWNYFNASTGMIYKTENYSMGKLSVSKSSSVTDSSATAQKSLIKPKEVQDFEKKNAGKKKVKVRDGSVN